MENVTINMVYEEIKKVNQRIATLEHLLIPEEKLDSQEQKELDDLIRDAKAGNITPLSKMKK